MIVKIGRREYSRYSLELAAIVVTVTEATPSEVLRIALVREDGYGDVITRSVTADGSGNAVTSLDLNGDTAATGDRPAVYKGMNYVRQGMYHVEARGLVTAQTRSVPISVIPLDEFRRSYLFGVSLHSEEMLMPVKQPAKVTGVAVLYVDNGMIKGRGDLVFHFSDKSLSWRGGTPELITGTEIQTLRLLTAEQDAYIEVEVDPAALPGIDKTESLLIDNWRLGDDDLRRYLWQAYDFIQQQLGLRLETTITTSDPDPLGEYYDEVADALAWERGQNRTIQFLSSATKPLQQVRSLVGKFVDQQYVSIPLNWITISQKAAIVELLPTVGSLTLAPVAGVYGYGITPLGFGNTIQDFWHYTVVAGLTTLDGGRYSLREAISKYAAIRLLTDLSVGAAAGRTSRSAQREGISESWSYGQAGVYGEKVGLYAEWMKTTMPRLRSYYRGLLSVTL